MLYMTECSACHSALAALESAEVYILNCQTCQQALTILEHGATEFGSIADKSPYRSRAYPDPPKGVWHFSTSHRLTDVRGQEAVFIEPLQSASG
ncbi:MAG TPA: hypothetical protein VG122_06490 [Gemmata sp.]|nr:hypothetical protein [Gemmata sp.]